MYHTILLIVAILFVSLFVVTAAQTLTPAEPVAQAPIQIEFASLLVNGVPSKALQQHLARAYVERLQAQGTLLSSPDMRVLVELPTCTPHALGVEYTLQGTAAQIIFSDGCELNADVTELPPYHIIILTH